VGIPRPSGGVTGAPSQEGLGGDSTAGPIATSTSGKQILRKFAIDIIDPKTMKNVDVYEYSAASCSIPSRCGKSSARNTPQPNTGLGGMDVASEFAALVAKAASKKPSPPLPRTIVPPYAESSQVVTTNGPDSLDIYSIPDPEIMPPGNILTPGEALLFSK
jgi:hypothetical protein